MLILQRIRANETDAGIDKNDHLHIQMMDELWGLR